MISLPANHRPNSFFSINKADKKSCIFTKGKKNEPVVLTKYRAINPECSNTKKISERSIANKQAASGTNQPLTANNEENLPSMTALVDAIIDAGKNTGKTARSETIYQQYVKRAALDAAQEKFNYYDTCVKKKSKEAKSIHHIQQTLLDIDQFKIAPRMPSWGRRTIVSTIIQKNTVGKVSENTVYDVLGINFHSTSTIQEDIDHIQRKLNKLTSKETLNNRDQERKAYLEKDLKEKTQFLNKNIELNKTLRTTDELIKDYTDAAIPNYENHIKEKLSFLLKGSKKSKKAEKLFHKIMDKHPRLNGNTEIGKTLNALIAEVQNPVSVNRAESKTPAFQQNVETVTVRPRVDSVNSVNSDEGYESSNAGDSLHGSVVSLASNESNSLSEKIGRLFRPLSKTPSTSSNKGIHSEFERGIRAKDYTNLVDIMKAYQAALMSQAKTTGLSENDKATARSNFVQLAARMNTLATTQSTLSFKAKMGVAESIRLITNAIELCIDKAQRLVNTPMIAMSTSTKIDLCLGTLKNDQDSQFFLEHCLGMTPYFEGIINEDIKQAQKTADKMCAELAKNPNNATAARLLTLARSIIQEKSELIEYSQKQRLVSNKTFMEQQWNTIINNSFDAALEAYEQLAKKDFLRNGNPGFIPELKRQSLKHFSGKEKSSARSILSALTGVSLGVLTKEYAINGLKATEVIHNTTTSQTQSATTISVEAQPPEQENVNTSSTEQATVARIEDNAQIQTAVSNKSDGSIDADNAKTLPISEQPKEETAVNAQPALKKSTLDENTTTPQNVNSRPKHRVLNQGRININASGSTAEIGSALWIMKNKKDHVSALISRFNA